MRSPIHIRAPMIGIAAAAAFASAGFAQNPDCESFDASQPQQGSPNVKLLYTWDPGCGADPDLGPLRRGGVELDVSWSHDTSAAPHEHETWDKQVPTGVHTYKLTLSPQDGGPYELSKSLLVSGTTAGDTDPDGDGDDADTDTGADDEEEGDDDGPKAGVADSGGCSANPGRPGRGLIGLLLGLRTSAAKKPPPAA